MPIHDWTRVPDGVCQSFHLSWCLRLKRLLNDQLLPPEHYALLERASLTPVDGFSGPTIGELLQRPEVPDVAEPILISAHATTGELCGRNIVVIRAEDGDRVVEVIRLPLRPAFPLPERVIVSAQGTGLLLPLKEMYASA